MHLSATIENKWSNLLSAREGRSSQNLSLGPHPLSKEGKFHLYYNPKRLQVQKSMRVFRIRWSRKVPHWTFPWFITHVSNHCFIPFSSADGDRLEQTLDDSEIQGSLECCSPWGCKDSDTTERMNSKNSSAKNSCHNIFDRILVQWMRIKGKTNFMSQMRVLPQDRKQKHYSLGWF